MKTIHNLNPSKDQLLHYEYQYQPNLTRRLDRLETDFNQQIINEIVLWKINRYAELQESTLKLINNIDDKASLIDEALTQNILQSLLDTKGVRLPMASTILRFKNPNVYQIIDQRVYRVIYGEKLKLMNDTEKSINQYFEYLSQLRNVCEKYNIPFSESDRILYEFDKIHNDKIDY